MSVKLQAIKIDRTVQSDREIQFPFKCFACHDGGLAGGRFLSKFVEGDSDIPFICNRDECEAGRIRRTAWSANSDPRYRNAFDSRLDRYACEDIHQWEKQSYIDDFVKTRSRQEKSTIDAPSSIVIKKYDEAVSDREAIYKEIETEIARFESDFINPKIENFLRHCRDRDSIDYINIKALPTSDYKVLLSKIKGLTA